MLDRRERIVGRRPAFAEIDIRDRAALRKLFSDHRFDAVIHFAGLKAVGESVAMPVAYYDNNVSGSAEHGGGCSEPRESRKNRITARMDFPAL